jgi:hypothetical protein
MTALTAPRMTPPARSPRPLTVAALLLAAGVAFAQPAPPPPALEPLPEIPPPPGAGDADLEPTVTIRKKDGEVQEEARVNGQILWIRVTPRDGRTYFLVPDQGGATYIRRDSLDTGLKVPLWLLYSF